MGPKLSLQGPAPSEIDASFYYYAQKPCGHQFIKTPSGGHKTDRESFTARDAMQRGDSAATI